MIDWTQQVDVANIETIKTAVYQLPTLPFTKFQEEIHKDTVHDVSDLALFLEQRKDRFILKK